VVLTGKEIATEPGLQGIEVIALVGPSGTGKSHHAMWVAQEYGCRAIIDDGLLISGSRIVAGKSAKREETKTAAVRRAVFTILKTVLPVILNDGCWALAFILYSVAYGRLSTQAFAAVQITNTIQNLFLVAVYGIASAASVMVGHKIGAGNNEEGVNYAWRFSALSWLGGLLIGGSMAAASPAILSLFNVSPNVYQSALRIQYITCLVMAIRVFNIVHIVGVLRGGGDVNFALIAEGITMWCIGVPLAFIGAFVLHLPVEWVVALVMAEEVAKFTAIMFRLLSKRWIKNVVNEMAVQEKSVAQSG